MWSAGLLALPDARYRRRGGARRARRGRARRLSLIGRIHRQLYDPQGEQLLLAGFLEQLGSDLVDASGKCGVEYRVDALEEVDLAPEAAVPMALIIAEAVTNAIEHGLAGRDAGLIVVRLTRAARRPAEHRRDPTTGAGLPTGFEIEKSDSLGLRLAQMLAKQLGGSFSPARR